MKTFATSVFVLATIVGTDAHAADIEKGETLDESNLKIIRPAFGLAPKHWDEVVGKTAKSKIEKGTPLDWRLIE